MNYAAMEGESRVARAVLEGAIRNVETAAELQRERFERSVLENWTGDSTDAELPEDRGELHKLYLAEYEKRTAGYLDSTDYEEIDIEEGIEQGIGIALDVLRKMLEQL